MLMQSALSCDSRKFLHQPIYRALSPTPPPSSDGIGGSLIGVSRKLQNLLNVSPAPQSTPLRRSLRLASPFHLDEPKPAKLPPRKPAKSATPRPKTPSSPPRTRTKRSRSVYEDDHSDSKMEHRSRRSCDRFSTPKRQKRFPYNMPLGLGIADFESLDGGNPRNIPFRVAPQDDEALPDVVLPSIEIEDTEKTAWTAEDDQKLVSVVLEKLKLSQREWEECAQRLGKDNASVGKRWQALVGEGNVGLRRGSGPFVRGRLHGCFD
ncbi:hypothetical protein BGW36DRAFT_372776 [Talaromyces proteolyticus]|uniref:Myb-like domain-containing protein n=1 Tax=Talaromyces proteolyticus TaxID=1131652 RepID=A0AAD4KY14_9EURO|nr:uncharacterized protein BGW36DRAFT_372776 [Talaromyces proteolyticus]KAH8702391.1 hypothetical protein BGW36DRAFT_372776 [Talaromyces proteolyticus]